MNRFGRFLVAGGLGAGSASFAQGGGVSVGVGIGVPGPVYVGSPVIYAPPSVIYGPPVILGRRPWSRILSLSLWVRRISRLLRLWLPGTWVLTAVATTRIAGGATRAHERLFPHNDAFEMRVEVARRAPCFPTRLACVPKIAIPRRMHRMDVG
jgi:hypothetical protein